MKKEIITTTAIIFSNEEISRLKDILKYARHRVNYHPESGIARCFPWASVFIEYMLKNI